jgi:hypothetical protein
MGASLKPGVSIVVALTVPMTMVGQLASSNYRAADNGSLTSGGIATSAHAESAIINVWRQGHVYNSTQYNGQSNVPGGFVFPCLQAEPPVITIIGDTLISSPAISYQWFFNGNIIHGAVQQFLVATHDGSYSVVVVDSQGCTVSSEVVTVGVGTIGIGVSGVHLYPNPTSREVTVAWNSTVAGAIEIGVYGLLGVTEQRVDLRLEPGSGSVLLDFTGLPHGVYLVRLVTDGGELTRAVVRQ